MQFAIQTNQSAGDVEFGGFGMRTVDYIIAESPEAALEVGQNMYPDTYINRVINLPAGIIYDNPTPRVYERPYNWREQADIYAEEMQAREHAKADAYAKLSWWDKTPLDDVDDALRGVLGLTEKIIGVTDNIFNKIFGE